MPQTSALEWIILKFRLHSLSSPCIYRKIDRTSFSGSSTIVIRDVVCNSCVFFVSSERAVAFHDFESWKTRVEWKSITFQSIWVWPNGRVFSAMPYCIHLQYWLVHIADIWEKDLERERRFEWAYVLPIAMLFMIPSLKNVPVLYTTATLLRYYSKILQVRPRFFAKLKCSLSGNHSSLQGCRHGHEGLLLF